VEGNAVKAFFIFILFFLFVTNSFGQKEFYIPLNIRSAYDRGTRSYDGNPGRNYWENRAKYNIKIEIDPITKLLEGSEEIIYYNNSPDSLSQIVVRLYQNINKATARRDVYFNDEALTNGVHLRKVSLENNEIDLNDNKIARVLGTNLFLKLNKKLVPNSSIRDDKRW
jgi:hypothetical protein